MSWLDDLLLGYRTVRDNGTDMHARKALNLIGFTVADNPATGATDVTGAGGGLASVDVVWQPGGTAAGRVYTSWSAACAAALAVNGPCTFWIDARFGSAQVPAGAWNFGTQTTLRGRGNASAGKTGLFALFAGTTFTNSPIAWIDIAWSSGLSAALVTSIYTDSTITLINTTLDNTSGSQGLYNVINRDVAVHMYGSSYITSSFASGTFKGAGAQWFVRMYDDSRIDPGAFSGLNVDVYIESSDCYPGLPQTVTGTQTLHHPAMRPLGVLSSGTTGSRPTGTMATGAEWFDTTLGKPIWWNGTVWKDATGATV